MLNKSQGIVKAILQDRACQALGKHNNHSSDDMKEGTAGNLGTIPQCWRSFRACRTHFIPVQKGLADDVLTDIG